MLDTSSPAEKVGIFTGLVLTCLAFGTAFVKAIKWIASVGEEHQKFLDHLVETEPLITRFHLLEEANKNAARERREMLLEMRGMRDDLRVYQKQLFELLGREKK